MQLISCHEGKLLTLAETRLRASAGRSFSTGLEALDALAPDGAFSRGTVHELLSHSSHGNPLFVATLLARSALGVSPLIWSDPHHELYPPALSLHGISLKQVYLLRASESDQTWAVAECLRCKGVGAVVAAIPRLSRVEARRLQLAAEAGGTTGIFLRPARAAAGVYAAATRWLVRPAPGERTVQRWSIQLLHGHGGRVGQTVILEYCRENNLVRATDQLADRSSRPAQPTTAVA